MSVNSQACWWSAWWKSERCIENRKIHLGVVWDRQLQSKTLGHVMNLTNKAADTASQHMCNQQQWRLVWMFDLLQGSNQKCHVPQSTKLKEVRPVSLFFRWFGVSWGRRKAKKTKVKAVVWASKPENDWNPWKKSKICSGLPVQNWMSFAIDWSFHLSPYLPTYLGLSIHFCRQFWGSYRPSAQIACSHGFSGVKHSPIFWLKNRAETPISGDIICVSMYSIYILYNTAHCIV